jgi:uncharacterized membrane protein
MADLETPPPAPSDPVHKTASETTGLPRHFAAGLATFFPLIGGMVFLMIEKKDPFVRFYAMQSVFLGGLLFAVSIAVTLAELIFRQVPLIGWLVALGFLTVNLVFSVGWLIVWIVTVVKALSNVEWEVPVLGALARKQLVKAPAAA